MSALPRHAPIGSSSGGLERALHFAGLQAASANVGPNGNAVLEDAQLLQVRIEATPRGDHGMTAVIAEGWTPATGGADARHGGSMLEPDECRKRHPSSNVPQQSLPSLLDLALGARAQLAKERAMLNAINVYPVADGDTGSNLLHTVDAVVAALRNDPAVVPETIGDAVLLGARGNSGTILSALVRTAVLQLGRGVVDGPAITAALGAGAEAAYRAVPEPVEGTMLTVARALAEASEGADIRSALDSALAGAQRALLETPMQLEQLRSAGVVDAGAAGLVAILTGLIAVLDGVAVVDDGAVFVMPELHGLDPTSRYQYCLGFVVRDGDAEALRVAASEWGDSLVMVGDDRLLRVHVHVDGPDAVLVAAGVFGSVSNVVRSDMRVEMMVQATQRDAVGQVALVYDSTADLPTPDCPNWTMVPLTVHFGDSEFRDYVDLTAAAFYERLAHSPDHPTTSQPSPGAFVAVYADLLERYEHVVSVHISSRLSGTYASALVAAEQFPGRVTVIDSRSVSMPFALGLGRAQAALDAGADPSALPALFAALNDHSDCLFSVSTLEYLQRGGRIGRAQALVGTLLGFHPILAIEAGEVVAAGRVRGEDKLLPALVAEFVERSARYREIDVAIAHAADPERAALLESRVRAARPGIRSLRILTLGAVVGAHAGPGALGLAYLSAD